MKSRFHKLKMNLFYKISNPYSILFHMIGIACMILFLVRVVPKPDRVYYPCQQMSMTVASSYIIFWTIIWSTLFHGLALWIRRAKTKTAAVLPVILVSFVFAFIDLTSTHRSSTWIVIWLDQDPGADPEEMQPFNIGAISASS